MIYLLKSTIATVILAISIALADVCIAGVDVIDWESGGGCSPVWTTDALRVTNSRGMICLDSSSTVTNGTTSSNDLRGMTVSHIHGRVFTPLGIDLAEYSTSTTSPVIDFIGYKPGGAIVSASFRLDGLADGIGGINDFQPFTFPADFADIIRLEIPTASWRCDNLTVSTIVPPTLPEDQKPEPAFTNSTLLYSKSINEDTLLIGSDFQFVSGFRPASPTRTQFLAPEGTAFLVSGSPHYDRATMALHYKQSGNTSIRRFQAGVVSSVVNLTEATGAGFVVDSISKPHAADGRLLFIGYSLKGSDSYAIFSKSNGVCNALVTPQTQLPHHNGSSTPSYFPNDLAVSGGSFAFDTSLADSRSQWRLYASFQGGPIKHIVAVTDTISDGSSLVKVNGLGTFEFESPTRLKVKATLASGNAWLHFSGQDLVLVDYINAMVSPVNIGKRVTGELFRTVPGVTFLDAEGEIYREHDGGFYRVIGVGDKIGLETVSYLRYCAVRDNLPLRLIVEVRFESSPAVAQLVELSMETPVALPPRFGSTYLHPESGELFIPLSHLTDGREYWLQGSDDMSNWRNLWQIDQALPIQHVIIPPSLLTSPAFFRVEQR